MVKMKMISPVPGELRCTSYNAIQAQLKMGANNIFVQLRAYDIQVCVYVYCNTQYLCMNIYKHVHIHTSNHIQVYACTCVCVCMYACMYACMYVCMYVCICVCAVCMHVCMCVHICFVYLCMYT